MNNDIVLNMLYVFNMCIFFICPIEMEVWMDGCMDKCALNLSVMASLEEVSRSAVSYQ